MKKFKSSNDEHFDIETQNDCKFNHQIKNKNYTFYFQHCVVLKHCQLLLILFHELLNCAIYYCLNCIKWNHNRLQRLNNY